MRSIRLSTKAMIAITMRRGSLVRMNSWLSVDPLVEDAAEEATLLEPAPARYRMRIALPAKKETCQNSTF